MSKITLSNIYGDKVQQSLDTSFFVPHKRYTITIQDETSVRKQHKALSSAFYDNDANSEEEIRKIKEARTISPLKKMS